ncbi:MAG TPA: UDP-N-acetylmuramoyl-L-alanyl-D-glutamate--2,6-diaminopimelate ligase [Candidatus Margulisiibacteriota bacterium]|nr:UDP-N-acetylmuramoyl-L-alanyl-D-glutamate--2,6-diaminopimelate ligase [Candidatus Margulisiibacteriota bacterium]
MKIRKLIAVLKLARVPVCLSDFQVKGISCNSKEVKKDFIFVAIKGNRQDGASFIDEAIRNGARAVVLQGRYPGESNLKSKADFIKVEDTRLALASLATEFYANPSQKIKVIGVTGTNGKTTITYLLEALLKKAKSSPGVIGTVNYRFKDKVFSSRNTTPGPLALQALLAKMRKAKVDYVAMEVSSHALSQRRCDGVNFHSAIFTNLTQDHLDYHKTLGNYFQSKARLFRGLSSSAFAVLNNDDKYARRLKRLTKAKVITYGIDASADVRAVKINLGSFRTEFKVVTRRGEFELCTTLIGRHNIYNILAAVTWALQEGIPLPAIRLAIENFSLVPGRLERVPCGWPFSVFVDYAHTEDALKNMLTALRELSPKNIIVVFGCGGERDKGKRPKMGKVVTELSDYAIITSDNPRSEEPSAIIEDIKKGIDRNNFCVIADRREAIAKSISLAGEGDVVVIAGKGHETYQIFKNKTLYFDDREVARECWKSGE